LQIWNFDKKLEAFSKSIFLRKNKEMISALNPKRYRERFVKNILSNYFSVPKQNDFEELE
jgi:hypothetical protein